MFYTHIYIYIYIWAFHPRVVGEDEFIFLEWDMLIPWRVYIYIYTHTHTDDLMGI